MYMYTYIPTRYIYIFICTHTVTAEVAAANQELCNDLELVYMRVSVYTYHV